MDEASEAVVSADLVDGWCRRWFCTLRRLRSLRWLEAERAVRPLRVVVLDEDAKHALEVAAVDDQQPVQAFGADGPDEPLRDGVCLRRSHRRLDAPDPVAGEDLVEGACVLAVAVADQPARALVGEVEARLRAC